MKEPQLLESYTSCNDECGERKFRHCIANLAIRVHVIISNYLFILLANKMVEIII